MYVLESDSVVDQKLRRHLSGREDDELIVLLLASIRHTSRRKNGVKRSSGSRCIVRWSAFVLMHLLCEVWDAHCNSAQNHAVMTISVYRRWALFAMLFGKRNISAAVLMCLATAIREV